MKRYLGTLGKLQTQTTCTCTLYNYGSPNYRSTSAVCKKLHLWEAKSNVYMSTSDNIRHRALTAGKLLAVVISPRSETDENKNINRRNYLFIMHTNHNNHCIYICTFQRNVY